MRKPVYYWLQESVFVVLSLLIELRCTVHIELAKCDCDQERLEMALVNIDKVRSRVSTVTQIYSSDQSALQHGLSI